MTLFRQALRSLTKSPGFALMAIATLSIGIGSATAIFSVVDAVLLEPLPFPEAGQLVSIGTVRPKKDRSTPVISGGDVTDIRARASSFTVLSTYVGGEMGYRLRGHAGFANIFFVDASFFEVLGVTPHIGHLPEQRADTGVVTSSFAIKNFGPPDRALGQSVQVDNRSYRIVAVVPDDLAFPEKTQLWVADSHNTADLNRTRYVHVVARVKPNKSVSLAQAELTAIAEHPARGDHDTESDETFTAVPLRDQIAGPARKTLYFLFAAVGLLLLIACANVANIMLGRAAGRRREIAIRTALGATGKEVIKLLLAESIVLAVASAALGMLVAWMGVRALLPVLPVNLPRVDEVTHVHVAVLCFAVTISAAMVLLAGLAPALQTLRTDVVQCIKQSPSTGLTGSRFTPRNALVIFEIAVCFVLCTGAGLLGRTLASLIHSPLGFQTENMLVMYADAPAFRWSEYREAITMFESSLQAIRALPDVNSAAAVMGLPMGKYSLHGNYLADTQGILPGANPFAVNRAQDLAEGQLTLASQGYFATMRIPIRKGRDFNERDQYDAARVAIVSATLARQTFLNEDPIGKRIYCSFDSPGPMTIVGVVGDVRQESPGAKPGATIYMPFQQHPYYANELQIVLRTKLRPDSVVPEVRSVMQRVAPFAATRFTTVESMRAEKLSSPRLRLTLLFVFAALAVGLALTGMYGVIALFVTRRVSELGIRIALGAAPRSILLFVLRRSIVLGVSGTLLGCGASILFSRIVAGFLFDVTPFDPQAYVLAGGVTILVAIAASIIPAFRAARLDPIVALRAE